MSIIKNRISKISLGKRASKNLRSLLSGTVISQLIPIMFMPVVTRLYDPADIGQISIYLSFFNFAVMLLSCRYDSALLVSQDDECLLIIRLSIILVLINACISAIFFGILVHYEIFGFGVISEFMAFVLLISLVGYGCFIVLRNWALRLGIAKPINQAAIMRSATNTFARILFGLFSIGSLGLFISEIIGSWAALISLTNRIRGEYRKKPLYNFVNIKAVMVKYSRYALYELPSTALNQLALALPVPIVASLYGLEPAGWFAMARLIYAVPIGQIGRVAADVFQIEISNFLRSQEVEKLTGTFYKFSFWLALIGLIPLLLALYVLPSLVSIIFGNEWRQMGDIVGYMAPWMYLGLVVGSLSRVLSLLQKQNIKLVYDFFSLLSVLGLYWLSSVENLEYEKFFSYLTIIMSLAYIIYYVSMMQAIRSFTNKHCEKF